MRIKPLSKAAKTIVKDLSKDILRHHHVDAVFAISTASRIVRFLQDDPGRINKNLTLLALSLNYFLEPNYPSKYRYRLSEVLIADWLLQNQLRILLSLNPNLK